MHARGAVIDSETSAKTKTRDPCCVPGCSSCNRSKMDYAVEQLYKAGRRRASLL